MPRKSLQIVVFRYTKATDVPPRENIGHAIPLPEDEILKYYCKWERNSIKDVQEEWTHSNQVEKILGRVLGWSDRDIQVE